MTEVWQTYYEKGKEDTEEEEKRERKAMATINNAEVVSRAVIETYIRKGLEANKEKDKGEIYTIRDYTIVDIDWGQYTELRPGKIYKEKRKWGKYLEK